MQQKDIPIFTALKKHLANTPTSFHVPGHKYGQVFPSIAQLEFKEILKLDATELSGLDDLHAPQGVIQEAQTLLAELYRVKRSFFLINGTTVGNLAMILAVCQNQNDLVLVQRNCHKSILHGLELAGCTPVFLHPMYDSNAKVPTFVSFETIKKAIQMYPNAKALILTNPNYYGMGIDLTDIVTFAHQFNIPVLVDEAHGAHFIASNLFPKPAVACGADIVVNSAHKTLPAMTMGSYLHFNSELIDENTLIHYLHILQSSSPSYPIMASLDIARYYLAGISNDEVSHIEKQIDSFKKGLRQIQQVEVIETNNEQMMTDMLKVTIQTRCLLSGYQLQSLFEKEKIFTELADPYNVLFVCPLQAQFDYNQVIEKISKLLEPYERIDQPEVSNTHVVNSGFNRLDISYQEMKKFKKKTVCLEDAVGKLAAEMITPYPPGIPLLMIGELITEKHIEQILHFIQLGAKIQSISLIYEGIIKVFDL